MIIQAAHNLTAQSGDVGKQFQGRFSEDSSCCGRKTELLRLLLKSNNLSVPNDRRGNVSQISGLIVRLESVQGVDTSDK